MLFFWATVVAYLRTIATMILFEQFYSHYIAIVIGGVLGLLLGLPEGSLHTSSQAKR